MSDKEEQPGTESSLETPNKCGAIPLTTLFKKGGQALPSQIQSEAG